MRRVWIRRAMRLLHWVGGALETGQVVVDGVSFTVITQLHRFQVALYPVELWLQRQLWTPADDARVLGREEFPWGEFDNGYHWNQLWDDEQGTYV